MYPGSTETPVVYFNAVVRLRLFIAKVPLRPPPRVPRSRYLELDDWRWSSTGKGKVVPHRRPDPKGDVPTLGHDFEYENNGVSGSGCCYIPLDRIEEWTFIRKSLPE